ncbi:MAG: hypothetical protein ACTS5I_11580 [Rhodanobacter sp.]
MTNMPLVSDEIKALLKTIPAQIKGSARLVALLHKLGITSSQDVSELCSISRRMAQIAAKQISPDGETHCAEAKPISPKAKEVSPSEMDCASRVHAPARIETPSGLSSSEERLEDSPLPSVGPQAEKPKRNGSRLPEDWTLPDDWRQWARINFVAVSPETVQFEADKFSAYWRAKAGKQATKLNWRLTWENWCRTAFGPPGRASGQPVSWGRNAWDERKARGRAILDDLRARQSGALQ